MRDPISRLSILPSCSVEFIAGMCAALTDDRGEVFVRIYAVNGKPVAEFQREAIDPALPTYLRKQSESAV